jgi:multiple sugar transport system permease protein
MNNFKRNIVVHFILIAFTAIMIFPFYWVTATAFKMKKDIFSNPPKWIFNPTVENFMSVLRSMDFMKSLLNSVVISGIVTVLVVIMGVMAAYAFSRFRIKAKSNFFFFVLTTRMGPPVAFILPLFIMMTKIKIIDTYPALILTYLLMNLAFCIWMMKGFIDGVPVEIDEAARIDGCSTIMIIVRIIWPLSRSGIFATAIFSFILTWNEFFYALNLTRLKARTFPVLLPAYMGVMFPEWEKMCAASIFLSLPVIVLALIFSKHLVKALTLGAVKG